MASYLLDTNHVSKVLDGHQLLRQRLLAAQQRGDEVGIPTTVLGELYFAVYASGRVSANLQRVQQLVDDTQVWVFDEDLPGLDQETLGFPACSLVYGSNLS